MKRYIKSAKYSYNRFLDALDGVLFNEDKSTIIYDYLNDIEEAVFKELSLEAEFNIDDDYFGNLILHPSDGADDIVVKYSNFLEHEENIAYDSKSKSEFRRKFKKYIQSLL